MREYLAVTDVHAPDKLRCNRVLQTLDEFYTTYGLSLIHIYIIPWCCIRRIGEDIILVEGSISSWRVMRKRRGLF